MPLDRDCLALKRINLKVGPSALFYSSFLILCVYIHDQSFMTILQESGSFSKLISVFNGLFLGLLSIFLCPLCSYVLTRGMYIQGKCIAADLCKNSAGNV